MNFSFVLSCCLPSFVKMIDSEMTGPFGCLYYYVYVLRMILWTWNHLDYFVL